MSKMFDCITETWNPLGGECPHNCTYCWAKRLIKRHKMSKYQGEPRIVSKELKRKFKDGSFVFVQDMSDLFAETVPVEYIRKVLIYINKFSKTTFLLLTKNPKRYNEFVIPHNCICGATIESDMQYKQVTKAPLPLYRFMEMDKLKHPRKMVSIEPIMKFSVLFADLLRKINPEFIYIGFDNYNSGLIEPSVEKVDKLISELEKFTVVHVKPSVEKRRNGGC